MNHRDKVTIDSFSTLERELYDAIRTLQPRIEAIEEFTTPLTVVTANGTATVNEVDTDNDGIPDAAQAQILASNLFSSANGTAPYTVVGKESSQPDTAYVETIILSCPEGNKSVTIKVTDANGRVGIGTASVMVQDPGMVCGMF